MSVIDKRVEYLRSRIRNVLQSRSKNSIVLEIKYKHSTFHQFNLDRFLYEDDVKLSTVNKIDEFITNIDKAPTL